LYMYPTLLSPVSRIMRSAWALLTPNCLTFPARAYMRGDWEPCQTLIKNDEAERELGKFIESLKAEINALIAKARG